MSAESFDSSLAEGLERLDYYSAGEHVEVEVTEVQKDGDSVFVTFDPPLGEPFTREFTVPHHPKSDEPFNRLLHTAGHGYSNANQIIGDRIPAEYGDEWAIKLDHLPRPARERVTDSINLEALKRTSNELRIASVAIYWPIVGLIICLYKMGEANDFNAGEAFFAYTTGTLLWLAGMMVVAMFVDLFLFNFTGGGAIYI